MNSKESVNPLYSELSLNNFDLPVLAERCNLLTEMLLDCHSLSQMQPVSRCLTAYLDTIQREVAKSMTDFYVVESADNRPLKRKEWLLEDTETLCDYSRALNHVLQISHVDGEMRPHLTGLLHDITHAIADDLNGSQIQVTNRSL